MAKTPVSGSDDQPSLGPKTLRYSRLARTDIRSQIQFTLEDRGSQAANLLLDRFDDDLEDLADLGGPGAARDDLRPGLRLHLLLPYHVYFRTTDREVLIVRVIHGSRDLRRIDFSPDE
jgi:toxin ParE1/3/4